MRGKASERGYALPVALAVAAMLLFAGLAAGQYALTASRAAADDRALAQARMAADTGVERIKVFLLADPLWSDGGVAEGPVDETSEVEKVTVEHTVQDGKQVAVVTSTGKCRGARKTVRAVIEMGVVPLVSAYGGGIKQLKDNTGMTVSGSTVVRSSVLVNGSFQLIGTGCVGDPNRPRTVYADGYIWVKKVYTIYGDAYATSWITPRAATGTQDDYWTPPAPFPDIKALSALTALARETALALERATGTQHYFSTSKTFTAPELAAMEGVYYVEGDAYLPAGTIKGRASVVAAGNIHVNGSLQAERTVLMALGDIVFKNGSNTSVALAVAGGDAGWSATGGGNAKLTLKCGALVAGTVNGGDLRGNVVLEQNDAVDFGTIAAPVHTARVVSQSEI